MKKRNELSTVDECRDALFSHTLYLHASPGVGKTLAYAHYLRACGLEATEFLDVQMPPPSIMQHMKGYQGSSARAIFVMDTDFLFQPPPCNWLRSHLLNGESWGMVGDLREPFLYEAAIKVYGPLARATLEAGKLPVLLTNLWPEAWRTGFQRQMHLYMSDDGVDAFFPTRLAKGTTSLDTVKEWNHKIRDTAGLRNVLEVHAPWELSNLLVSLAAVYSTTGGRHE